MSDTPLPTHRTRSDWLELLQRCQNGEATCLYVLNEIERLNVPVSQIKRLAEWQLKLCNDIEGLIPECPAQAEANRLASLIYVEMDLLIHWPETQKQLAARRVTFQDIYPTAVTRAALGALNTPST